VVRDVLATVRARVPRCRALHVFYAGPTGGAVVLGQAMNPRMNPVVHLYEYSRQASPRYRLALILTEELAL
jgi:arabinogalactan endo-1,4-beta-galactosidase